MKKVTLQLLSSTRCSLGAKPSGLLKAGIEPHVASTLCRRQQEQQHQQHQMTDRDVRIQHLADDVFSRGNQHLKNVERLTALPEGLHSFPEVCFIGKPNAGKSSLVSCLLHNASLAKGGRVPGTTRLLQYFNVGDCLALVDTPGYGGWKGRFVEQLQMERARGFAILFQYLAIRRGGALKRVYWVMEASATEAMKFHPRDEEILAFLTRERIPFTVILSKIDRHWRHYQEDQRPRLPENQIVTGKDGIPIQPSPARRDEMRNRKRDGEGIRGEKPEEQYWKEGIQRNMKEVHRFLGYDKVPLLAVSANRQQPNRCVNLDALRYDIMHYCTMDIREANMLTYDHVKNLSYAPPTADDIQRVQLTYPIQSFVVPNENQLSLEEMVRRHEAAKRQLLSARRFEVTAKVAQASGLGLNLPTTAGPEALTSSPAPRIAASSTEQSSVTLPDQWHHHSIATSEPMTTKGCGNGTLSSSAPSVDLFTKTVESAAVRVGPSSEAAQAVLTAVNGVQIPWSLVPSSVEKLANTDSDSLNTFITARGAGAYDAVLRDELLAEEDVEKCTTFMEHTTIAKLDPRQLGSYDEDLSVMEWYHNGAPQRRSARRRRLEKVMEKYLKKSRKERSLYVSAEGYMCPWLNAGRQSAVMGTEGSRGAASPRSGAVMMGLKKTGFGGKSYSARTLKQRGRATRKTGSWAA